MTHSWRLAAILATALGVAPLAAQDFDAPRGDRTSGYRAHSRSEVLARNGMIAISQPLATPQAASDAARFNHAQSDADAGGYQAIGGVYRGASDHRKDGAALGW